MIGSGLVMEGVREYAEGFEVKLDELGGRAIVNAWNEGGCNVTQVDLLDLLKWVEQHKELIKEL